MIKVASKISETPIFLAFLKLTIFLLLAVIGTVFLSIILTLLGAV